MLVQHYWWTSKSQGGYKAFCASLKKPFTECTKAIYIHMLHISLQQEQVPGELVHYVNQDPPP